MRNFGPVLLLIVSASLIATDLSALSDNLDALIADNEIVMPADMDQRYAGADAVILLDRKEVDQGRTIDPVYVRRHTAVKIMTDEGVSRFSTIKIPYYREVKVNDIKAQIIRGSQTVEVNNIVNRDVDLENMDPEFVFPTAMGNNVFFLRPEEVADSRTSTDLLKLTTTEGFHKQGAEAWRIRQIDFPALRPGDVIEYEYQLEDKRAQIYGCYYFEREYPALKLQLVMKNARMMRFNYQLNNFTRRPQTLFEPRFNNLEEHDNMRIRNALRTVDLNNPDSWQFHGHQYFEVTMDTVDAFPADLPLGPTYDGAAARVDFLLADIFNIWYAGDNDARVRKEYFSPSWNFVFNRINEHNLVDEGRSRRTIQEISKVIASASSPEAKVSAAVAWARENLKCNNELERWQGYYWSSKAESPDKVLGENVGNRDDIAHFLVSALWFNNLQVFPFYTKSRQRGELIKNVPIETQFDNTFIALEVSRRRFQIWQPVVDVPMPPEYIDCEYEGQVGFVNQSDKDDISVENADVPVTEASANICRIEGALDLAGDGTLSGTLNHTLNGHVTAKLKRNLLVRQQDPAAAWAELLNSRWDGVTVTGAPQMSDPNEYSGQMTVSGNVSISGAAMAAGDGLVLKSSLVTDPYSIQLDGSERDVAVIYPHTGDFQSSIEINIPAGYALPDSMPEPVELKTRGFTYTRVVARQTDNKLMIKRDFTIDGDLTVAARVYNRRYAPLYKQVQEADTVELQLKKL